MRKCLLLLMVVLLTGLGPALAGPIDSEIDSLLVDYFKIQTALASDTTENIDVVAKAIHKKAEGIEAADPAIQALLTQLKDAANQIQGEDLEGSRDQFFALSKPLLVYLQKFHSEKERYSRYFCGMAKKGWIQSEEGTRNPYYGGAMLTCGDLIK